MGSCLRGYTLLAALRIGKQLSNRLLSLCFRFLLSLQHRLVLSSSLLSLSSSLLCELLLLLPQFLLVLHRRSVQLCFVLHRHLVRSSLLLLLRGYGQPPLVVRLVNRAAFADPLHCRRLLAPDRVRALGVHPVS